MKCMLLLLLCAGQQLATCFQKGAVSLLHTGKLFSIWLQPGVHCPSSHPTACTDDEGAYLMAFCIASVLLLSSDPISSSSSVSSSRKRCCVVSTCCVRELKLKLGVSEAPSGPAVLLLFRAAAEPAGPAAPALAAAEPDAAVLLRFGCCGCCCPCWPSLDDLHSTRQHTASCKQSTGLASMHARSSLCSESISKKVSAALR